MKFINIFVVITFFLIIDSIILLGQTQNFDLSIIVGNNTFPTTSGQLIPPGGGSGVGGSKIAVSELDIGKTCRERWICTSWSSCFREKQEIECYDYNSCGTFNDMPPLERLCEEEFIVPKVELPEEKTSDFIIEKFSGQNLVGILILLMIILYLAYNHLNKGKRKKQIFQEKMFKNLFKTAKK